MINLELQQQVSIKKAMTDLSSMKISSDTKINDLKKARVLLRADIKANPDSTTGWIAVARVEELDGKLDEARKLLEQAWSNFPTSEDVWAEYARLAEPKRKRFVLAKSV